ncbi:MAG TPA: SusC/RagA family TonB-linked outer membrane protein [Cytophagales bacterium]|jgi:TonB-dependent starch-binding outer membrane protein SusC|nr:SusC/RagA family TonB-linked outer membrane protein [Cytophagales bacterium]
MKKESIITVVLFTFLISLGFKSFSQVEVSGVVRESSGVLPGVNIQLKGTAQGTVTDTNGLYKLTGVPSDGVLVFSFVGYATQEIQVGGRSTIDVTLIAEVTSLNEVVVVGYGVQKKSVVTSPISKVDSKDLAGFSVPRVDQMLQGQMAGVTIKSSSGQPGSGLNIFIRGVGTNGDNSPLIIIDGLVTNDGILSALNPADIQSVEVLKDGSAAAIYGARSANGVILITTKKAKDGKATFTYNGSYGIQQPWRTPKMLNSSEYVSLIQEKYANGGSPLPTNFPDQNSIQNNTNWMKAIFQSSATQSHQLSVSKGTDAGSFLASFSYYDQKGVIAPEKSNLKRITARVNSEQKINNFLSFGENLFVMHLEKNSIPENSEFGTPIADALVYDPTTAIYDKNAEYGFAQSPFVQKEYINPLSRIFISNRTDYQDEVTGNLYFKVTPIKNLVFKTDLGVDYSFYTGNGFSPSYHFTPAFFNTINDIYQYETKARRWQWENYATYSRSFGKHSAEATFGTTAQVRYDGTSFSGSSSGVQQEVQLNPNFWYITGTPDSLQRSASSSIEKKALQSFFGRINYNYDEKYLLTVSLRRDGSSQFGANYRYGLFPAGSVGWVISREKFWPQSAVTFAKLRASYGVNGNDRIGTLAYASTIERTGIYPFGKPGNQTIYNGLSSSYSANPNIRWEQSKQLDIGLEAGLWNDKLVVELDYYVKTTSGLLMASTVPDYIGTNAPTANVGEVVNKGWEIDAKYRTSLGPVKMQFKLSGATLNNKVTVVNADGYIDGYTWPIRNTVITRMEVGQPIGFFRGYKTNGIFKNTDDVFAYINSNGDPIQPKAKPGDLKFVDANHDGVIDSKDIVNIGKPWPDLTIGFNANFNYKQFDLRMLFAGSFGNQIYRSYERQDVPNNNYQRQWLDRWTPTNTNGKYPRLTTNDTNNNTRASDFYVESASYLRLRNIQLGYTLPTALMNKVNISQFRVYVSFDNLLTFTKYTGFDPEIGTSGWILDTGIDKGFYPQLRTVSFGANLSF